MGEKTFKGTPGPWLRDRHGQRRGANGESVIVWDAGIGWGARTEVSEANAYLIAAAPALLAACQTAMPRNLDTANPNIPDDQIIPLDFTMGELRAIHAAISQALGQESGE